MFTIAHEKMCVKNLFCVAKNYFLEDFFAFLVALAEGFAEDFLVVLATALVTDFAEDSATGFTVGFATSVPFPLRILAAWLLMREALLT